MEDCSTDEQQHQETLCQQRWTAKCAKRPETLMRWNVVVVWIQCLLVDVDHVVYAKRATLEALQLADSQPTGKECKECLLLIAISS